jgi:hypothetical protein
MTTTPPSHMFKRLAPRTLSKLAAALLLGTGMASVAYAQMKVGQDPATLAPNANLQVQGTNNDAQFLITKDKGNVGVGTTTPGNRLHVDSGTDDASGVRMSRIPNARLLGTNASGDVVPVSSSAAACTCGDIKAGLQAGNHGSWRLLDGTAYECNLEGVSLSINANTTGGGVHLASAAAGESRGVLASSNTRTIARNQLPNVPVTGRLTNLRGNAQWQNETNGVLSSRLTSGNRNRFQIDAGDRQEAVISFNWNLNGNVTQQPIDIRPLGMRVNYFVCIPGS